MKVPSNSPLLTYIAAGGLQLLQAELFTVELRDGSEGFYTDLDMDIEYSGETYLSNSIRFEGLRYKVSIGLEVDEQELRLSAFPGETLVDAGFFTAVGAGLLDGAYITHKRAYWSPDTGIPAVDYLQTPLDVFTVFIGRVATIAKLGRTHAELKIKSPLSLLDIDMPRNTYQPGCQWLLYDQGCTVNRAANTASFTVASATETTITVSSIAGPTGADGLPTYLQGRLLFTSGANDGLQTIVASNSSTVFTLQYPLLEPPAAGDTFDVSKGCAKTTSACDLKFNNLLNFRGFPRVPPIVVSV